jgi:mannose-6-phosphate isomerase-like protein (cupin superfamily)
MTVAKHGDFKGGWMFGDFEPSLWKTKDFEVGIKTYQYGYVAEPHYHQEITEWTMVLNGEVEMNGQVFTIGDIITIWPNEIACFKSITDSMVLVVKTPSIPTDKHSVANDFFMHPNV